MTEYSSSDRRPASGGRVPRATQRFLGVIAHLTESSPVPSKVRIERDAWQFLLTMLERVGSVRNGPLWGSHVGDQAMVTEASHCGYGYEALVKENEVAVDPAYILGWSDCLSSYGSNELDWIGHWVMLPANTISDNLILEESLLGATSVGILTDKHFLVYVGVDGEQVKARAYLYMQDNPVEIDVVVV